MTSTFVSSLSSSIPSPSPQGGGERVGRRGACPGLSSPMQTGDGLLVRLRPTGTVPLDAFAKLCAAARTFGNGIVEITARGSIQIRGLDAASAAHFAAAVGTLGIAAEDGVPVHTNSLAGLDPHEVLDAGAVATDLRRALADQKLAARLSPKISVTVDGSGALNLDRLSADVRLCAEQINDAMLLRMSVGGDAASASDLGFVEAAKGVAAAVRLIEVMAQHGRDARAKDIIAGEGIGLFALAVGDLLAISARPSAAVMDSRLRGNDRQTAIGAHSLRDGSLACGLGLAFGHADATALEQLAETAALSGATGMRAAPGRALIVIGLAQQELTAFAAAAERLGFITRADDVRGHVFACAGAPLCASAHIAARTMAPAVTKAAAQFLDGAFSIHISGCAKGCAHPSAAALTVVGTPAGCGLIADGLARDAPFAVIPSDEVNAAVAKYARELADEGLHV
jgi:precorrin-3B synthase